MTGLPLVAGADLDAPLAWRSGAPISRRRYLEDVEALAARLPSSGPMLDITSDRYRFAVGLGAALVRGHANLLPPNHTPDMVARLQQLFPGAYALVDVGAAPLGLPTIFHASDGPRDLRAPMTAAAIDPDALAAQVLTSGSTGAPLPHAKRWGLLVANTAAGADRLAAQIERPSLAGVSLVATVPAQHMYGFESSVLVALLAGAAFEAERPFYPADIAAALARVPRPRLLVTTPFHLKLLLDAGVAIPAVDLTVCATAPLAPQLAARAEAELNAPLMEIYGCTEAGQVASRRTTRGAEWQTYRDLRISGAGDRSTVSGGHVPEPTVLADVLEVVTPTSFRLLGRSNDLINVAGKRSSLAHLNFHLNTIEGVDDGAFWLPDEEDKTGVARLVAFVVAPGVAHERIVAALRERVDAAFLPRRIVDVPSLPREPTGKLAAGAFGAWAREALARQRAARRA